MSDDTPWVKASSSDAQGQCVELRRRDGMVEIRDSKDRSGPVLSFSTGEWKAFLDGATHGEFDHLG